MLETFGYCGVIEQRPNPEVDVDGQVIRGALFGGEGDIILIGKAILMENGNWRCLANTGMLCVIEIRLTFPVQD